jgi:hypothetical protein
MDSAEISNILRGIHRNKIKSRTSSEDIFLKKSMFTSLVKYSLKSKKKPEKRTAFKIKIAEYLKV